MCGIISAINFSSNFSDSDEKSLITSLSQISHRGPDNQSFNFLSSSKNTENKNIFLGHTRLSIIDLNVNSNQPFESDELIIIFNGEIFNYIELRKELKSLGHSFRTDSDTEVIIKSFIEYGNECFKLFNGMWSIIIFNKLTNEITVSRDRLGIKPLFYLITENKLFLSSEIPPLLNFIESEPNIEYLKYSLSTLFYDTSTKETYFNNIFKFPAASFLTINLFKTKSFFEINPSIFWKPEDFTKRANIKNVKKTFKKLLIESVKIRLRSDVQLTTMLSGGLDSSSITYLADSLKKNKEKTNTFSIISNDPTISEESFIDILVDKLNLKSIKKSFNADDLLNNLNKTISTQHEPFAGFSVVAQNLLFQKISETGNIVVLSGQGGDEALMGYLKYYYSYMKFSFINRDFLKLFNLLYGAVSNGTILKQFSFKYAFRYMKSISKKPAFLKPYNKDYWLPNYSSLKQIQTNDIKFSSIPALTRYEDRNSMFYGLETRHPFLDHKLIEFSLSVDSNKLISNGWNKLILRESMTELPKSISFRKDKKGFEVPHDQWLKKELKTLIIDSFKSSILDKYGIINSSEFIKSYKEYLSTGSSKYSTTYFSAVLNAELWAKKFIK